jgi:hypothetical protein
MNTAGAIALALGGGLVVGGAAILLARRQATLSGARAEGKSQKMGATKGRHGAILRGYTGKLPIKERVSLLQDLVAKSVKDPDMRGLALGITSDCEARDGLCEIRSIGAYTKRQIRYTGDIAPHKLGAKGPVESVDLYQSARRTSEYGGGDCDDHAVFNASMLILNGIPAKFRVTSPYRWGKDNFTHIYTMAGLPKGDPQRWIAVDTTLPDYSLGKEYPFAKNYDAVA